MLYYLAGWRLHSFSLMNSAVSKQNKSPFKISMIQRWYQKRTERECGMKHF